MQTLLRVPPGYLQFRVTFNFLMLVRQCLALPPPRTDRSTFEGRQPISLSSNPYLLFTKPDPEVRSDTLNTQDPRKGDLLTLHRDEERSVEVREEGRRPERDEPGGGPEAPRHRLGRSGAPLERFDVLLQELVL